MTDTAYRNDREAARGRLVALQNELHERRARLAELTRRVNLLGAPKKKIVEPRIPHSKLRVQVSAICALFTGYGMQQWMGETNVGRLIGIATTAAVFIIVNWFVPWPLFRIRKKVELLEASSQAEADQLALEDERRACEKLEREIAEVQRVLGSRSEET